MHSDKKLTKEDTWRPEDLRRYVREEKGQSDGGVRRREGSDRKHRAGESTERRHRDPEKESRRERDKHRERESTRDRGEGDRKDRHVEQRKEGSRDRRGDKERDRRDERDKEKERMKERDRLVDGKRQSDDYGGNKDRKTDKEDKHDRERDQERHRNKEKDRVRDGERRNREDGDKGREDREKERRREERDREHRTERERRRREESGDVGRDRIEKNDREKRERPKDDREEKRTDKERRERHGDRKPSEQKEERGKEYKEEPRRHKEERERRHKEGGRDDPKRKHDSESRDTKRSGEEERHRRGDRERGDGDKQRERRHREDKDPERKHREGRHREEEEDPERNERDKKSVSDKSHRPETNTVKAAEVETELWTTSDVKDVGDTEEPVVDDEDLVDQQYEDDFEDYEEDFEEMDPSENEDEDEKEAEEPPPVGEEREEVTAQKRKEIEAIQRAMNEENERVGTDHSTQSTSREEEDAPKLSRGLEKNHSRASQRGKFIDFVAAKQREVSKKVSTKQKKRSTELLKLIDLDFSMTVSLLDLPPVNEYDMYIRTFGTANTKQAYVQCNEDNADRDVQTEEIEVSERWTQHPPEHSGACGDSNFSQEAQGRNMYEMNFDSQRLSAFLRSASQVLVVLLEESQAERKSLSKLRTQKDKLSFSDGSLQLNTKLPFLYGRHISLVHFSQVQRHTMMSVHAPTTKPSSVRLNSCTLICIWNIWEPSRPQKILVYESEVQCCCFSPGKATLVFAGTSVGSVVLWDLREQTSNHYCLKIGEEEWTFRQPTFSTSAVMAASAHLSSVSSVEVVPSTAAGGLRPEVPLLASEEESSGLSFQLASLDESGVLNFWVVVELPKANEAGSPTDLGLRPGGKVKLLHSSSLLTAERVSPRDAVKTGPLQTLHLKFLPSDSNHFFIGTNMGLVNHGTSHSLKATPKFYRFQEPGVRPVDVTSIHFSPFRQNMFLVGCGDGSIRLHTVSHEQPVAEWRSSTAGEPVVALQWAHTRPAVFCVLDAASHLHVWDLLKSDTEPVLTERISADRVTAMAVFGDSGKQNTYSGIALVHESGKIEMQYFTRDFTVTVPAEEEKLETMMTEAF
ncbi:cytoplasmic dynein 2 intermediate chain 1 isoform X1 [Pleuronectes platessa]|uniref:cytoplasmic dynein 2 intermediate chain 1 isoform X1 n=1 Tax=Pleuronectes platessa TaxID=8262 RepID=UPI00232A0A2F|nr:cytoplasmic dynein 2 intermediate chain 1 isoform X1 [Pleuronectes platessa]